MYENNYIKADKLERKMNKLIRLTESDIRNMVIDAVRNIMTESTTKRFSVLYHKAPVSCRKSILRNGLTPSVGDSYKAHWDDMDDLTPYVFLYDHNTINGGEYDSTYDDDIYVIDVSQLDLKYLDKDPDRYMRGCYVYSMKIPPSAIKLVYKGSKKDSGDLTKHFHIYESASNGIEFIEQPYGDGEFSVSAYNNGSLIGYMNINIFNDLDDLDSEISDTDSYETATEVIRRLDYNTKTIELADVDVRKEFRHMGVSKMLLEYVLNRFKGCQFYLRVCPTDGVDELTLAKSVMKYGFINVDSTENGTFLVKRKQ